MNGTKTAVTDMMRLSWSKMLLGIPVCVGYGVDHYCSQTGELALQQQPKGAAREFHSRADLHSLLTPEEAMTMGCEEVQFRQQTGLLFTAFNPDWSGFIAVDAGSSR